MPTLLWWGRSDPDYSRNRIVQNLLFDLGWTVQWFHPKVSELGRVEAFFRRPEKPDIIWVPCFRHRDMASAAHWADRWEVPLIFDPLISAYEKEVFERQKYDPVSSKGRERRQWEARIFAKADMVVSDTLAHGDYFRSVLQVRSDTLTTLYVGAETDLFTPSDVPMHQKPYEILFFGSFLSLQGAETIVAAAKQTRDLDLIWTLLGEGDSKRQCMQSAKGYDNIRFEPWVDYQKLPERIARSHVLLGIFGDTPKAALVIPNKVFQAMAVGRPVITRRAQAYDQSIQGSETIGWVLKDDSSALAFLIRKWFEDPLHLIERGRRTRHLFERFFSEQKLKAALKTILEEALRRGRIVHGR